MEGGAVGHNFKRNPHRDHPCQVRFNLVQRFQRRRYKCENLRCTTDGRMPSDGKSSHGLWPGELKYYIIVSLEYQGWFWLENKITENQWKIAETIYTPFSNGIFLTCSDLCQTTFCNFFPEEISWNQLNNWTKIIPVRWLKFT